MSHQTDVCWLQWHYIADIMDANHDNSRISVLLRKVFILNKKAVGGKNERA